MSQDSTESELRCEGCDVVLDDDNSGPGLENEGECIGCDRLFLCQDCSYVSGSIVDARVCATCVKDPALQKTLLNLIHPTCDVGTPPCDKPLRLDSLTPEERQVYSLVCDGCGPVACVDCIQAMPACDGVCRWCKKGFYMFRHRYSAIKSWTDEDGQPIEE